MLDKPRIADAATQPNEHEEIEITQEMIEAGMKEYAGRWPDLRDADDDVAREMLRAAFSAMYQAMLSGAHAMFQTGQCDR